MEIMLVAMNGHQRAIGSTNFSGETRERIKGVYSVYEHVFIWVSYSGLVLSLYHCWHGLDQDAPPIYGLPL
jgi:hypothetical protein